MRRRLLCSARRKRCSSLFHFDTGCVVRLGLAWIKCGKSPQKGGIGSTTAREQLELLEWRLLILILIFPWNLTVV